VARRVLGQDSAGKGLGRSRPQFLGKGQRETGDGVHSADRVDKKLWESSRKGAENWRWVRKGGGSKISQNIFTRPGLGALGEGGWEGKVGGGRGK